MPVVTVVANVMTKEKKRDLVRDITAACVKAMDLPPETVVVVIDEKSPENIGVSGGLLADRK